MIKNVKLKLEFNPKENQLKLPIKLVKHISLIPEFQNKINKMVVALNSKMSIGNIKIKDAVFVN